METELRTKIRETIQSNRQLGNKPKLAVVSVGGGVSLTDILRYPGASSLVHGIYLPYSFEETGEFLRAYAGEDALSEYQRKSVDALSAANLLSALKRSHRYVGNASYFAVTAALTTDRYRRGENHAYIAHQSGENLVLYHLSFSKLPESLYADSVLPYVEMRVQSKRNEEDETIANVILDLYCGKVSFGEYPNASIRRL